MQKQKTKNFSLIAEATKTAVAVLVAGKFETLGSNFSNETRIFAMLLPSFATILEVFRSQR